MKIRAKSCVLFVWIMWLLSSLACITTQAMGELRIDETVVIEAHDETDHVWTADVEPGKEYVVSVTNEEYGEASYYGQIYIYDEGTSSFDASNLIADGEHFTPSVSFVAPEDGTVTIIIYMINWINTDIEVTLTQSGS